MQLAWHQDWACARLFINLMPKLKTVLFIQLSNCLPLLGVIGLVTVLSQSPRDVLSLILVTAAWIYLLPPLMYRFWTAIRSKPQGRFEIDSSEYRTWWVGVQFQVLFLRFAFLEELLRLVPMLYSFWLRLWGARIGKAVYWSPKTYILDRGYLDIGDFVVVGVGTRFASHLVSITTSGNYELLLESPRVQKFSILGGYSGLGPGSFVEEKQMLPSHFLLAPGYGWSANGRQSPARSAQ